MRSKLYISIGVIVIFIIGLVGIVIKSGGAFSATNPAMTGGTSASLETTNPNATQSTSSGVTSGTSYTMTQVAAHNAATSCWTAINGGVYDVTNWINQHPGGPEAILSLCGKDGSAAFNGQHGGEARPAAELASFRIGAVAK